MAQEDYLEEVEFACRFKLSDVIDYITFQSGGGANDFGDLTFP